MRWKILVIIGAILLSVAVFNLYSPPKISWLKAGAYAKYDVYNIFFQDHYIDEHEILSVSNNEVVIKHNWLRNETLYVDLNSRKLLKAMANGENITALFIRPPFKSYYYYLWTFLLVMG